MPDRLEFSLA